MSAACKGLREPFDMRQLISDKSSHPEETTELGEYHAITAIFGSANSSESSTLARDNLIFGITLQHRR